MTRKIREIKAVLMAAMIMISMQASALAANITVVQDTDINVEQYSEPQKAETTFTETESTTITSEFTTEYITKEYTTEETTETTTEETTEEITEETTETTEATTEITTEEITEITEATTEAVTLAPGIDIDVLNSNYFQIQDNYGNIYIYVYTGTDVKLYTQDGKEADVDILTGNDIQIVGDGGPLTSTETTTETTTVYSKSGHSGSSGGHRRIRSVSTTTEATTEATTKDMQSSQDKKTVRMQIGNNSMYVDGSIYETDSSPYISQGYTLVPLRCISAVFDAQVGWDNNTKTAYINTDNAQTCFTIASDRMVVNGCYEKIPKSAEICAGRTYVPIRALGEALGADVSWIQDTKTVVVTK